MNDYLLYVRLAQAVARVLRRVGLHEVLRALADEIDGEVDDVILELLASVIETLSDPGEEEEALPDDINDVVEVIHGLSDDE